MGDLVQRLGHITYEVSDLAAATEEMTSSGQLEVAESRDGEVFLRGDLHHYWLRLVAGPSNRFVRVGYEVGTERNLEEIARRLEGRGVAWKTCDDAIADDRVEQSLRFTDSDGIEVELYTHMLDAPTRRVSNRVRLEELLHAVFFVRDVPASAAFYQEVLGFKVSDWTERAAVFMRCGNRYHHSLAFFQMPGSAGSLAHYAVLCEDIDDVMVARNDGLARGVELAEDLVRHGPSGSVGVYLRSTTGLSYEFCTWHAQIDDPGHQPRILPVGRSTVNIWELPAARAGAARP